MRALYPEEARRQGLEGNVRLRILVDARGRVSKVRVIQRAGNGFDQAAVKIIKKFKFRPATRGGRPVAVWITWLYKFRLES